MVDQENVDNMETVWFSIEQLCSTFGTRDWGTATDCPGWSVQDQLSHLVGSECSLLGLPLPDHVPVDIGHVKNETGHQNEVLVDVRRSQSGTSVLEEFREVTAKRLSILHGMTARDFSNETETPIGLAPVRELLAIRIFDAWVHEQDMRRAVGQPGHMEGRVPKHAMDRMVMAMPYVVGKKVQPSDGTTVVLNVNGPAGRVLAIAMDNTRANFLDSIPNRPSTSLSMDLQTFSCLSCGRWDPLTVLNLGRVHINGDQTLGKSIVEQLNFMI